MHRVYSCDLDALNRTIRSSDLWRTPCQPARHTTSKGDWQMNFNLNQIAAAASTDQSANSAELNLPKAIMGALGGALVVGLVYGVVGRFVGEYNFLAIAIGSASGLLAVKLGGKASPVVGGVAAA